MSKQHDNETLGGIAMKMLVEGLKFIPLALAILLMLGSVAHADDMALTFEKLVELSEMLDITIEGSVIEKAGSNETDHFITFAKDGTSIGVIRKDDGKNTHYWEEIA